MTDQATQAQAAAPTPGEQVETKATQVQAEKTFTQDYVTKLIQKEKADMQAKYGDYEEIKAKLAEIEDANKSELEKALEKTAAAEAKVAAYEKAAQAATWRAEVRKEKGLPESSDALLTGETLEEIRQKADALVSMLPKGPAKPIIPSDRGENFKPDSGNEYANLAAQLTGG